MKRETRRSRWKALLWQLACALVLTMMVGGTALAASTPVIPKTLRLYLGAEPETISLKNSSGQAFTAENIKVGNKKTVKVETVKNAKGKTLPQLRVTPLKTGSTTVKFDLKRGTTTKSCSVKVTVTTARPFASFKIGPNFDYASMFSSESMVYETCIPQNGKLNIQMSKGWTLKGIELRKGTPGSSKLVKKLKNKSTVDLQRASGRLLRVTVADSNKKELDFWFVMTNPKVKAPDGFEDFHCIYHESGEQNGNVTSIQDAEGIPLEIKDLKSSNEKVAVVSTYCTQKYRFIQMDVKKAGTTKISFRADINGKWKSYSFKLYAEEYENPFVYLKIGSKDYAGKFDSHCYYEPGKTLKGKLDIKLKDGWKLGDVVYYPSRTSNNVTTVKNKKDITLKKTSALQITMTNEERGLYEAVFINHSIFE